MSFSHHKHGLSKLYVQRETGFYKNRLTDTVIESNTTKMVLNPFRVMCVGLLAKPLVPCNLMSKLWKPCSCTKVPDCPPDLHLL